ncbi:collagen, type I, alpha 1b-like [Oryctolagus cuniculus]|uniref:collagen, type I, alpha 1b-like n=1 Tax=Oryctolagus cuniculus TaxID=9986 RepID=UPI003879719E
MAKMQMESKTQGAEREREGKKEIRARPAARSRGVVPRPGSRALRSFLAHGREASSRAMLSAGRGARAAAGAGRAPGRPEPGPGPGPGPGPDGGRGGAGPVQTDGRDGAGGGGGGGWGSLSPQSRPRRVAGRSGLAGSVSSSSSSSRPLASRWGSSAEASKTGGRGPSWARRAPRRLCDPAERGARGWASERRARGRRRGASRPRGRGPAGAEAARRRQSYPVSASAPDPCCATPAQAPGPGWPRAGPRAAGAPWAGARRNGARRRPQGHRTRPGPGDRGRGEARAGISRAARPGEVAADAKWDPPEGGGREGLARTPTPVLWSLLCTFLRERNCDSCPPPLRSPVRWARAGRPGRGAPQDHAAGKLSRFFCGPDENFAHLKGVLRGRERLALSLPLCVGPSNQPPRRLPLSPAPAPRTQAGTRARRAELGDWSCGRVGAGRTPARGTRIHARERAVNAGQRRGRRSAGAGSPLLDAAAAPPPRPGTSSPPQSVPPSLASADSVRSGHGRARRISRPRRGGPTLAPAPAVWDAPGVLIRGRGASGSTAQARMMAVGRSKGGRPPQTDPALRRRESPPKAKEETRGPQRRRASAQARELQAAPSPARLRGTCCCGGAGELKWARAGGRERGRCPRSCLRLPQSGARERAEDSGQRPGSGG